MHVFGVDECREGLLRFERFPKLVWDRSRPRPSRLEVQTPILKPPKSGKLLAITVLFYAF